MANSHVPKFGNWEENDDIPYTAFFDNARKDKPSGNVKINPNDPQENPEAFMMMQRKGSSRAQLQADDNIMNPNFDHNPHASVLQAAAAQPPRCLMKSTSTQKSRHADEDTKLRSRSVHDQRNGDFTGGTTGNYNYKSSTSESGSEKKTSSDYSLLPRPHNHGRHIRSDQDHKKKTSTIMTSSDRGIDSSSSASERGHRRNRSGSNSIQNSSDHGHHHHHRATSIPKFGSWDVNDPKSGEGYTILFDKVKEEKQSNIAAGIKVPTIISPPPPQTKHKDQSKPGIISSCISKICCCMSSSGSE